MNRPVNPFLTPKTLWAVFVIAALLLGAVNRTASSGPIIIAVPTATPIPAGMTLFSLGPGYAAVWVPTEFAEGIVDIIT